MGTKLCFTSISVLSTRYSSLSSDQLIRLRQHVRRNRQADLLGRFQIDDELELRRLFHWQVWRLSAFQDLVDHRRYASVRFGLVGSVGHQATAGDPISPRVNRRQ